MAYRNGTYVAFNGMGTTDPTKSDMKFYGLLQSWDGQNNMDFKFNDSHKKTYSVYDTSSINTLKDRLQERFRSSKNMLLIVSEFTSVNRGMLNWEIEQAVDVYRLPIIVCYTGYESILNPNSHVKKLPKSLIERIQNSSVKAIHIPFRKIAISTAINQFSIVNNQYPRGSYTHYTKETYERWKGK